MLQAAEMLSPQPGLTSARVRKRLRSLRGRLRSGSSGSARTRSGSSPAPCSSAEIDDPVLAAAQWAARAAVNTPRTARKLQLQCPVQDPRQLAAPEPPVSFLDGLDLLDGLATEPEPPPAPSGPSTSASAPATAQPEQPAGQLSPPSVSASPPATAQPEQPALPECTCEFSDAEHRCVHVSLTDAHDEAWGGYAPTPTKLAVTLPATVTYADARRHLDAQLPGKLPPAWVFVRGGIPVGKKQEHKWAVQANTLAIKPKAPPANPEPVPAQPQAAAPFSGRAAGPELRIDPEDGCPYDLCSFLEVYGPTEGIAAWGAALPLPKPAARPMSRVEQALQDVPWTVAFGPTLAI